MLILEFLTLSSPYNPGEGATFSEEAGSQLLGAGVARLIGKTGAMQSPVQKVEVEQGSEQNVAANKRPRRGIIAK